MPKSKTHPALVAISERVSLIRTRRGLSVAELARRSGVSRPTIAGIEQGNLGSAAPLQKVLDELGLELRASRVRK